jgi:hypothetical protein
MYTNICAVRMIERFGGGSDGAMYSDVPNSCFPFLATLGPLSPTQQDHGWRLKPPIRVSSPIFYTDRGMIDECGWSLGMVIDGRHGKEERG